MSAEKIIAETRTEFGKGAARRIRRDGKIPAVLYGHGGDPVHLTLPGHDTMMALKHGGVNAVLHLMVDGKEILALSKQIQTDPIRREIEHVDFVIVIKGEKVTVEVPIHVVGEPISGNMVMVDHQVISVEAEATHIPEFFEVSAAGLDDGAHITAADVALPKGVSLLTEGETLILSVTHAAAAQSADAGADEAAEAAAE